MFHRLSITDRIASYGLTIEEQHEGHPFFLGERFGQMTQLIVLHLHARVKSILKLTFIMFHPVSLRGFNHFFVSSFLYPILYYIIIYLIFSDIVDIVDVGWMMGLMESAWTRALSQKSCK